MPLLPQWGDGIEWPKPKFYSADRARRKRRRAGGKAVGSPARLAYGEQFDALIERRDGRIVSRRRMSVSEMASLPSSPGHEWDARMRQLARSPFMRRPARSAAPAAGRRASYRPAR